MKLSFVISVFAFTLTSLAHGLSVHKAIYEAKKAVDHKVEADLINGMWNHISKKVTKQSRAMEINNVIVRDSVDRLIRANNVSEDEATRMVWKASGGVMHAAGHKGFIKSLAIPRDMCSSAYACSKEDIDSLYRRIDGRCNNIDFERSREGSTGIAHLRLLEPCYRDVTTVRDALLLIKRESDEVDDDAEVPQEPFDYVDNAIKYANGPLPSQCGNSILPNVRLVSTHFHTDKDVPDELHTHMLTQVGQFLDHDITLTPETEAHDCCLHPERDQNCFPINLPENDPYYSHLDEPKTCIEFTRSVSYCHGQSKNKEQFNVNTAFVDASQVYGSDLELSESLRTFEGGQLKVSEHNLLPQFNHTYTAGDERALDMPGLASIQTLLVREHNRIVQELALLEPWQTDEELFQKARRIVIGQWQNIVYSEFLPIVLSQDMVEKNEMLPMASGSSYNPSHNPTIINSFATAAFRFGHSLIQGLIQTYLQSGQFSDTYLLRSHFFNADRYKQNNGNGMENILKGLTVQPAQKADRHCTHEVTSHLFPRAGAPFGEDLVARNLQRGRDHGMPGWNQYRRAVVGDTVQTWYDKPYDVTRKNWKLLAELYENVGDIEMFPGGFAETALPGGILGRTFSGIILKQFRNIMLGDRYFFTHTGQVGSFSLKQRQALTQRKLSDILCDNTGIDKMQDKALYKKSKSNKLKSCREHTKLPLEWFL